VKVIGLTGGIGMGKSACAALLRERNIPVVDTDDLSRQVVKPGETALDEIRQVFGPEVFDAERKLLRRALAEQAFANPEQRKKLESILHPRIRQRWLSQVATWREEGESLGMVVIPLLFETNAEKDLDFIICVACTPETQKERLVSRNWPPCQMEQRIQAQLPVEQKMARADFVIWSEGSMEVHAAQLDKILARVR
jgi:dephospho-CoA kinase